MINSKITWVNHAGYILSHKNINLLVDPWHSGTAFNDGWSLLSKTYFPDQIAKSITHIWISHEHPDHFSVQNLIQLRKINKENIKVFFQETKDKRVYSFLKKIGFDVHELKDYEEYKILDDFKKACDPKKITVIGDFHPRGGIKTTVKVHWPEL